MDNWIATLTACGFTAVGFNEYIKPDEHPETGEKLWNMWGSRGLSTPGDTILRRLKDAGFKILLRVWAGIHKDRRDQVACEYGSEVIGPRQFENGNVYSLNVYSPKSIKLISDFATAIKGEGIYDMADWVSIGWDDSGEVDDIRDFAEMPTPELDRLTRPVRPPHTLISRTEASPARAVTPERAVRIHDAHEAIGIMFKAVLDVFGNSKPIGCMRGSCWHDQPKRRNLPFFPGETLVQTNDVNQLANTDCTGVGFASLPVQREALCFACDILRGSGVSMAIIEADGQTYNLGRMDPPAIPPPPPPLDPDSIAIQTEFKDRALIAFRHGISHMLTHMPYTRLGTWQSTLQDIAASSARTAAPLPEQGTVGFKVTGNYPLNYIPDVLADWRSSPAGGETVSKPVAIQFALD